MEGVTGVMEKSPAMVSGSVVECCGAPLTSCVFTATEYVLFGALEGMVKLMPTRNGLNPMFTGDAGLNVQLAPGSVLVSQANEMFPVYPFNGVIVSVAVAVCPAVPEAGVTAS